MFKKDFFLAFALIVVIAWTIAIFSKPSIDNRSINFSIDIVGIGNNNSNSNDIDYGPLERTKREIEARQEEIKKEIAIIEARAGGL